MPISRAQPADLPELAELFAGYLDFYQVPRPLPELPSSSATPDRSRGVRAVPAAPHAAFRDGSGRRRSCGCCGSLRH